MSGALAKKSGRPRKPPGPPSTRFTTYLSPEIAQKIEALAKALQCSKSSIISQAVARWYRTEPLVNEQNGASNGANNA